MKHRYLIIGILLLGLLVGGVQATNTTAYDGNLTLLLHNNGINASTSFYDSALGATVSRTGNPYVNNITKYLGNGSGYFDGTNDQLYLADSTKWDLSQNFTISLWFNSANNNTQYRMMVGQIQDDSNFWGIVLYGYGVGYFAQTGGVWRQNTYVTCYFQPNVWNQLVLVSNSNTITYYLNGVSLGTTPGYQTTLASPLYINSRYQLASNPIFSGYMDEIAIWNASISIANLYPMPYEIKTTPDLTPVASFTPSGVVTGTSPLSVTLNDTSTNTPTYGNWTYQGYGSNTTFGYNFSTSLNTTTKFTAGNFSISHGAGNSAGFNLSTQITWVNVTNPIPVVSFTANVTSGIAPLAVALSDTSTGNMTSRFWNFGDNTNSTVASPTHTYTIVGTYIVNLTEINLDVSNSTTKTISVYNPANSQFSSYNTAGTAPFSTYLYDLSTNTTPGPDTYYWMFGDGNTSTSQSLYYTWNITGTYAVNHSFSNGASTSWNNKSAYITVGTPTPPVIAPVASFYGGPQIGAPPLLVYLTDVSTNTPTSWNWSFGDGTYGITQNPSHWYNSSGFFTVGLTATNSAGSNTTSQNNFIMVY